MPKIYRVPKIYPRVCEKKGLSEYTLDNPNYMKRLQYATSNVTYTLQS